MGNRKRDSEDYVEYLDVDDIDSEYCGAELQLSVPKKNFFISYNMIFDLDIPTRAKIAYLYLCRCADNNCKCFPSYHTIGHKCGYSSRTALSAIKDLMREGLLIKKRRKIKEKDEQTSNMYILFAEPQERLKETNVKQLDRELREYKEKRDVSLGYENISQHNESISQPNENISYEVQPNEVQPNYKSSSLHLENNKKQGSKFVQKFNTTSIDIDNEILELIQISYDQIFSTSSKTIMVNKTRTNINIVREKLEQLSIENIYQVAKYIQENKIKSFCAIKTALYNSFEYIKLNESGKEINTNTNKKKNGFLNFNGRNYSNDHISKLEEFLCLKEIYNKGTLSVEQEEKYKDLKKELVH